MAVFGGGVVGEDGAHGELGGGLDEAGADGVAGEGGGVVDVELFHEVLAVFLDGLDADAEVVGGLLVGIALGDELEDFDLALGQASGLFAVKCAVLFVFFILGHFAGGIAAEVLFASGDFADGMGEDGGGVVFGDKAVHPGFEGMLEVEVFLVGGEHEDAGGGGAADDVAGGVEAVEVGHGHIEGHDVGFESGGFFGALASVVGLTDNFEVFLLVDDGGEGLAHHFVVIDDEDSGLFHGFLSPLWPGRPLRGTAA